MTPKPVDYKNVVQIDLILNDLCTYTVARYLWAIRRRQTAGEPLLTALFSAYWSLLCCAEGRAAGRDVPQLQQAYNQMVTDMDVLELYGNDNDASERQHAFGTWERRVIASGSEPRTYGPRPPAFIRTAVGTLASYFEYHNPDEAATTDNVFSRDLTEQKSADHRQRPAVYNKRPRHEDEDEQAGTDATEDSDGQ